MCCNARGGGTGLFSAVRHERSPVRCKNTSALIRSPAALPCQAAIIQSKDERVWSTVFHDHPHAAKSHHRGGGFNHISNFALKHLT
jgi:hypothetical protein